MAQPISIAATLADDKADRPPGLNPRLLETVEISLEAYLGRATMTVGQLSALEASELVALDAPLNQAVALKLNGVTVAKGELVAAGDNFAIRLTEIAR